MSERSGVLAAVESKFAALTERERVLVGVMVAVLSFMAFLAVTMVLRGRAAELQEELEDTRSALNAMIEQRDVYLRESTANTALWEALDANSLRLSTFIEGRAGQAGLPSPTEFRDAERDAGNGVVAVTTTAEFTGVELRQLERMMRAIEESDELVYVHQLAVEPARRGENLDVELTLVTFRRGGE